MRCRRRRRSPREHSTDTPSTRRTFRVALDAFVRYCTQEKGLRGSTMHEYQKIGERLAARPWRGELTWADRVLDTFTDDDLLAVRQELVEGRAQRGHAQPLPARRARRLRDAPASPALAWAWMAPKVESEGKLHFYTPEQVAQARSPRRTPTMDAAIYTARDRGGPEAERDPRSEGRATSTSRSACCASRTATRRTAGMRATRAGGCARCR